MGRFNLERIILFLSLTIAAGVTQSQTLGKSALQEEIDQYFKEQTEIRKITEEDRAVLEVITECAADLDERLSCKERVAQLSLSRDFHSDAGEGSTALIDDFIKFYSKKCAMEK